MKRFVAPSFTGWSNARSGSWVKTEDDPLDPTPLLQQRETLAAIKFLERAVLEAPLEGIVVRYGGLYGPGASDALADILDGQIATIRSIVNPDKLGHLGPVESLGDVLGEAKPGELE